MTKAAANKTSKELLTELRQENSWLRAQVKLLRDELYGSKSERSTKQEQGPQEQSLFADVESLASVAPGRGGPAVATSQPKRSAKVHHEPMGPKPLNPNLPREVIVIPCPDLKDLICPATGKLMQPGFTETIEVLARRPAQFFVKSYQRVVYVSPAKEAPVYAPWPDEVLPRARVHASIVGFVAAEHYSNHQPFNRIEQTLSRQGIELPRVTQVSMMEQLDRLTTPLVAALKTSILTDKYLHIDATPIDECDPQRPGAVREACLWALRAHDGPVYFEYRQSKSPEGIRKLLVGFQGKLQTDGAAGLDTLVGENFHYGCFAHARRYFDKAVRGGDENARQYLELFNFIFKVERRASHFNLAPEARDKLRQKYSLPRFQKLCDAATEQIPKLPPKTSLLAKAFGYLLGQRSALERCLRDPQVAIDNNAAERAIRPLKIGMRNWLFIGHPSAGPRLAHLFTLVENCRLVGVDPEAYLIDIIARLPGHLAKNIADLFPAAWQKGRNEANALAATKQVTPDTDTKAASSPATVTTVIKK
jgi:transposase